MISKGKTPHSISLMLKVFALAFLNVSLLIVVFCAAEIIVRVKTLGYKDAIYSLFYPLQQPSVLGVSDWVISDPDLNYRLNPSKPEVNRFSMLEEEIVVPKPSGVVRIIILGDSIPFSGDPSFVNLLKEKYAKQDDIEILNASTPGYTTYQEMVFLDKYLLTLEPDIVILAYCLNDNHTFLHRFDEKANMLWTEDAENSLNINSVYDAFVNKSYFLTSIKTSIIQKQKVQETYKYPWENDIDFNTAWKDYSWIDFSSRIKQIKNMLTKNNGKLFVVIFPLEMQLDTELLKDNYDLITKPQLKVLFYCDKYDIPCIDLFDVFLSSKKNGIQLYIDGLHLSSEGHAVSSKLIYDFLNKVYFENEVK